MNHAGSRITISGQKQCTFQVVSIEGFIKFLSLFSRCDANEEPEDEDELQAKASYNKVKKKV
jgi:hypothetical protein